MIISESKCEHLPEAWEMVQELAGILADGGEEFSQVDQFRSVVKAIGPRLDAHFNALLGPIDDRIEQALEILKSRMIDEKSGREAIQFALETCGEDVKAGELANLALSSLEIIKSGNGNE